MPAIHDYTMIDITFHDVKAMQKAMNEIKEYKYFSPFRQQGKTYQMSCYNLERELHDLRGCGCNACKEKHYHLERDYYRRNGRRYYYDEYNRIPTMIMPQIASVDYNKKGNQSDTY